GNGSQRGWSGGRRDVRQGLPHRGGGGRRGGPQAADRVQQRAEPLRGGPELHRQERAAAELPQRDRRPPHEESGRDRAYDRHGRWRSRS
ncbi:unnamed protein product, partial [Ectocarpus fasciculatus]